MTIVTHSAERMDNGNFYPTVHINFTANWIKDPHNAKARYFLKKEGATPGNASSIEPYSRSLEIALADLLELEQVVKRWFLDHGYQEFDFINRNFKTPEENAANPPARRLETLPILTDKATKDLVAGIKSLTPEERKKLIRSLSGR